MGLERVAAATAAVLVNGRRCGSATLVTSKHLVTAAHVLRAAGRIEVAFPRRGGDQVFGVRRVELIDDAVAFDVAVLELDDIEVDRPVEPWAWGRLPTALTAFGYPLAEHAPVGVWRRSRLAGPVGRHAVQVDWAGGVGALEGQSGGPVVAVELLALSDQGAPAYDHDNAAALHDLGVPAFACTPDLFPDLMAAAIERRDLATWAHTHDLPTGG